MVSSHIILVCTLVLRLEIAFHLCSMIQKNIHLAMHAVAIRVSINDFIPLITQSLIQEYWSHPSDLEILIGPCIKAHSLELDDISALNREAWKNHVMIHNNGNHSVDLISRVVTDLSLLGIKYNNIYRSIRDTGNDDELFSHYRSTHLWEEEWRFLFCVGLK